MTENQRNAQTTINVQKQANLIWNVADILRGLYKPHEYGKVILPITVIKRLHDTLLPTRDKVLKASEQYKDMNEAFRHSTSNEASETSSKETRRAFIRSLVQFI